jgi:hypothetical protein
VIVLGDIFAKGPQPRRTWDLLRDVGAEGILGNHDARMLKLWGERGDSPHHAACAALDDAAHAWIAALPLFLHGTMPDGVTPWVAVHAGVNPELGWMGTERRTALVVRRWPDDTHEGTPFWWQLYRGPEHVFYGHDAVRGLQLHAHSTGLDSGCVYGNQLSGWLLEESELLQVSAQR